MRGLTAEERERRERPRLETSKRFERSDKNGEIAADLPVTVRTVERWRRARREQGRDGLLSKGSASLPRLSAKQFARLERGPRAYGFEDQRWTLANSPTLCAPSGAGSSRSNTDTT